VKYTFTQVYEGEWAIIHPRERWCCCDCGLAHRYEFRVRKGVVSYRCYRDGGMTRASRARKKHKFKRIRK
jgi:hypothetical protein